MSNLVLYRKYRPQKFAEVISQEHVKTTLANAVVNGRVGHAYLFTGPRGVGKTTIARILARAVNCQHAQNGEPDNTCDICKDLMSNTALDLMEIDAASHTGVDNIRDLIEHLKFAPTRAKFKVIIIDEVHMLSKGAFNALLKTLEEPPAHAIFILATTEVHKLPATIVSRTQRFDFKKVSVADIVQQLEFVLNDLQIKASKEALIEIALAADGGFRDALSLLDQVITFADGEITESLVEEVLGLTSVKTLMEFFGLLLADNKLEAVNFVSKLMYAGRDLYQFQKDFLEYLRKLLLCQLGNQDQLEYAPDVKAKIVDQANAVDTSRLLMIIELFQKAGQELKWNSIPSLPLEIATLKAMQDSIVDLPAPKPAPAQQQPSAPASANQSAPSQGKSDGSDARPVLAQTQDSDPQALQTVVSSWSAILEKTKEYNHSLISTLKIAVPVAVRNQKLLITLPYKFHLDVIGARKNKIVLDQVIEEVTGLKLMTEPILAKDWEGQPPDVSEPKTDSSEEPPEPKPNLVESALKIMGGEVE